MKPLLVRSNVGQPPHPHFLSSFLSSSSSLLVTFPHPRVSSLPPLISVLVLHTYPHILSPSSSHTPSPVLISSFFLHPVIIRTLFGRILFFLPTVRRHREWVKAGKIPDSLSLWRHLVLFHIGLFFPLSTFQKTYFFADMLSAFVEMSHTFRENYNRAPSLVVQEKQQQKRRPQKKQKKSRLFHARYLRFKPLRQLTNLAIKGIFTVRLFVVSRSCSAIEKVS